MRPLPPAVLQELGGGAAGVFEGVGEDSKPSRIEFPARQNAIVKGGLGKLADRGREPDGVEGHGVEGVANDVSEEGHLDWLHAFEPFADKAECLDRSEA